MNNRLRTKRTPKRQTLELSLLLKFKITLLCFSSQALPCDTRQSPDRIVQQRWQLSSFQDRSHLPTSHQHHAFYNNRIVLAVNSLFLVCASCNASKEGWGLLWNFSCYLRACHSIGYSKETRSCSNSLSRVTTSFFFSYNPSNSSCSSELGAFLKSPRTFSGP